MLLSSPDAAVGRRVTTVPANERWVPACCGRLRSRGSRPDHRHRHRRGYHRRHRARRRGYVQIRLGSNPDRAIAATRVRRHRISCQRRDLSVRGKKTWFSHKGVANAGPEPIGADIPRIRRETWRRRESKSSRRSGSSRTSRSAAGVPRYRFDDPRPNRDDGTVQRTISFPALVTPAGTDVQSSAP